VLGQAVKLKDALSNVQSEADEHGNPSVDEGGPHRAEEAREASLPSSVRLPFSQLLLALSGLQSCRASLLLNGAGYGDRSQDLREQRSGACGGLRKAALLLQAPGSSLPRYRRFSIDEHRPEVLAVALRLSTRRPGHDLHVER
jgi:hypothetical protein